MEGGIWGMRLVDGWYWGDAVSGGLVLAIGGMRLVEGWYWGDAVSGGAVLGGCG